MQLVLNYDALKSVLPRGQHVLCVEPGGNYGDDLIYEGAYLLFQRWGVSFSSVSWQEFLESSVRGKTLYVHGSGGLVPFWSGTPFKIIRAAAERFEHIVLGPSSCSNHPSFLRQALPDIENLTIFAREHVSYDILAGLFSKATVRQLHDTAIALSGSMDIVLAKHGLDASLATPKYDLLVVRHDKEKARVPPEILHSSPVRCDPVVQSRDMREYLLTHMQARTITTNRLHSAVLGVLFGKPTTMFANSYHKNRSMWSSTLQHLKVEWIGPDVALPLTLSQRLLRRTRLLRDILGARFRAP